MQIVINIPEEVYDRCKEYRLRCGEAEVLEGAVARGIPLPKGHGELKDTKAILDKFVTTYDSKIGLVPNELAEGFVQCEKLIKIAPTIVEADKEKRGMNMVEVGKSYRVYAPMKRRVLDEAEVTEVQGSVFYCYSKAYGYDTAYDLADGIIAEPMESEE